MSDPLDRPLRLVFGALALAFAATGLLFFLFPDGTVRALNAAGRPLGFPDAPPSALRFWLSLGLGYMVLVTILAATIARDPRRHAALMPILAAGKATSSLTCLGYFIASSPAFIYLANALVDGSLALIALGAWAGIRVSDDSAKERDGVLLRAVLDALVPRGETFPTGAADTDADVARYFASLHPLGPIGLRLVLLAFEWGAVVFERTRPFSRLEPTAREEALAAWEASRLAPRRQLIAAFKLVALMHFYDRRDVWPAIGYDDAHLRAKLLAGPNAAHHAPRLAT